MWWEYRIIYKSITVREHLHDAKKIIIRYIQSAVEKITFGNP